MTKDSPTPTLGKPRRDEKVFTFSENKVLDQITVEIMEAWKKDLIMMKNHYKKTVETSEKIMDLTRFIEEKLPKLEEFLKSNDCINAIPRIEEEMQALKSCYGGLEKSLSFLSQEKLMKSDLKPLTETFKDIERTLSSFKRTVLDLKKDIDRLKENQLDVWNMILEMKNKCEEKWWRKWFKPKT